MSPPIVAAVVVTHNGERWLSAVIDGLLEQTYPADLLHAIDTGSRDSSVDITRRVFGPNCVTTLPSGTSFPQAMAYAVASLPPEVDWVWVLHDDSRPAPEALEKLLARVELDPEADFIGAKLREWPSLRRLLEVGVTMSGTGRRETGLERGEYDQGQHDEAREVLAVQSAGMLARRSALDALGGFDPALPIFGNDIDLGWRAAAAGYRTVVEPAAVVFHAEAAHRGLRRTPLTGRHTHYAERRAALFTMLVNARPGTLPFVAVRLGFGSLLRVLGLLMTRRVGQALDELAALLAFYAHPRQIHQARAMRRELYQGDRDRVRRLLAPWWLPYRQGLDQLRDALGAATRQAQDVAERRRLARAEANATPASRRAAVIEAAVNQAAEDDEVPTEETGLVVRYFTSPAAIGITLFTLGMLFALWPAWGNPGGGWLPPAPTEGRSWWQSYLAGWHPLEQGTTLSAPPYVVLLSALAVITPGGGPAALSWLLFAAAPVGMWGAWRLLRVVGRLADPRGFPTWLIAGGAGAYALLPITSGAFGSGRLGLVVAAAVLPWFAHAALGFADPEPDRRWRAGWRTGLLLTVVVCFVPSTWPLAVVGTAIVVVLVLALMPAGRRRLELGTLGPALVSLAVPVGLLIPWWLSLLTHGSWAGLLLDAGRLPTTTPSGLMLLDGRVNPIGLTGFGLALAVLAVLALIPRATRLPVAMIWALVAGLALVTGLWSLVRLRLPFEVVPSPVGLIALLWFALFLVAATLAGGTLVRSTSHRTVRLAVIAVAVALPAVGLGWAASVADNQLHDEPRGDIPVYMIQNSQLGIERGVLVVRGSVAEGFTWTVRRDDGLRLGEQEIARLQEPDAHLDSLVAELVRTPSEETAKALAAQGLQYVVMPAPVDGRVSARLDAASGLTPASAETRDTRAWLVDEPLSTISGKGPLWRPWALGISAVLLLVVLVMAGPSRRASVTEGEIDE